MPLIPEPPSPDGRSLAAYTGRWAKTLRWTAPLLVVFFLTDVAENLLFGISYAAGWTGLGSPIGVLTSVKWLSVGFLAATVVYVRVAAQPAESRLDGRGLSEDARAVFRGLVAMRVPLVIFLLVAGALALGLLDQIPDAIRRWSVVQLAAAFYFVAGLSVALWMFGLWVYRRVTEGFRRYEVDAPAALKLRRRVGASFLAAAAGQTIVWAVLPDRVGLGLLVPAAIVLLFFVTSAALPTPDPPEDPPPPRWPRRIIPHFLPRFLAAAAVGALGLAALNAAIPTMVVKRERAATTAAVVGDIIVPVLLIVATVATGLFAVVRSLRVDPTAPGHHRASTQHERRRAFTVLLALAVVPPVALWTAWMTGLGDELRDLPAISANWLLLAATLALVASAAAYYLYDADYFPLRWGGGWFAGLKEFAFDKSRGGLDWSREAKQLGSVSAVVYLLMGLWLVWKPLAAAPLLGTVGVASLWVTSFAAVALVATIFAERTRPPRLLSHLGVNRLPVFALLAVWVLAAQIPVLREPTYHDVRIAAAGDLAATAAAPFDAHAGQVPGLCDAALPSGPSRIDMEDALCRWLAANDLLDGRRRGAVPMVFVSAWGGGIRAGAWTALAMDCIFEPDGYVEAPATVDGTAVDLCRRNGALGGDPYEFSDSLFALSGISGGSLGFAEYAAYLSGKEHHEIAPKWVRAAFGADFLAPTVSQLLFVDVPLSLFGYVDGPDDRATVTERAWEAAWAGSGADGLLGQGLFRSWRDNRHVPLLVLNGTSHTDACRFNASVLDAGVEVVVEDDGGKYIFDDCTSLDAFEADYRPAPTTLAVPRGAWALAQTRDLVDFLCEDQDVRLSTAALLSARFPAVSPPGRIDRCAGSALRPPQGEQAYVTDGGNLELSGTLTAFQLWDAVAPMIETYNRHAAGSACIVPFMIHLENGYRPPGAQSLDPSLPNEWLAPARSDARDGLVKNARINAALPFDDPLGLPGGTVTVGEDKPREFRYSVDQYAFLTTRAHPGVQAPFGWALSEQAIEDLENQLLENAAQLAEIGAWFSGGLSCG